MSLRRILFHKVESSLEWVSLGDDHREFNFIHDQFLSCEAWTKVSWEVLVTRVKLPNN